METKKSIVQRNYYSTNDFVKTNKLEAEAEKCFGKGWKAEDDVCQIEHLLEYLEIKHYVVVWEQSAQSDNDIRVTMSDDLKRIDELEEALKLLISKVNLSRLDIRKDFELINAHACANKVLNKY